MENQPYDREAYYRIGKIYYTKVKYLSAYETGTLFDGYRDDRSHLDKFIEIFKGLIEHYPDDKDGHLFLGLGYLRLKDYSQAYRHFDKAKSLMPDEELALFTNIGYLKAGAIAQKEFHSFESDTSGFFYHRDPLYLTPYNEREMEHYCRVAEANLLFSNPNNGIEGWKTEQGKILIKYGPPKNRVKAKNDAMLVTTSLHGLLESVNRGNIGAAKMLDTFGLSFDFWHYDDFAFVFSKGFGSPDYNYKLSVWNGMNLNEIAQDEEEKYPEYYDYEPKGLFRGEKGRTRMEVYYGVPFNKVKFEEEGEYYYGNYEVGVFLHDRNWKRTLEDVQYKDLQFKVTGIDTSSDAFTVDQLINHVEPDSYYFAVEIQDRYSDNVGTYRDTVNVEEYGYETLQISDIQTAFNIKMLDSLGAVTRENLIITPNPPRFYRANQPIYIYYEI
ncbi:hypothetical protein AMJ80_06395 [bacterium SM23_31]|nr:MAG: hypothetical protein AMJ80_06395 [bacterium SM23_31]